MPFTDEQKRHISNAQQFTQTDGVDGQMPADNTEDTDSNKKQQPDTLSVINQMPPGNQMPPELQQQLAQAGIIATENAQPQVTPLHEREMKMLAFTNNRRIEITQKDVYQLKRAYGNYTLNTQNTTGFIGFIFETINEYKNSKKALQNQ